MKHEAGFQQISRQAGYYQMTNCPNVGGGIHLQHTRTCLAITFDCCNSFIY